MVLCSLFKTSSLWSTHTDTHWGFMQRASIIGSFTAIKQFRHPEGERGVKPRTSPVESTNLWGRMVEMWGKNVGHGACIHAAVPVRLCLHRKRNSWVLAKRRHLSNAENQKEEKRNLKDVGAINVCQSAGLCVVIIRYVNVMTKPQGWANTHTLAEEGSKFSLGG